MSAEFGSARGPARSIEPTRFKRRNSISPQRAVAGYARMAYVPVVNPLCRWRLKRVVEYVDANIGTALSLPVLAASAMYSRMHFARQFQKATGLTPHAYVLSRRVEAAKVLLASEPLALKSIASRLGFRTQAHFANVFRDYVGESPGRWRRTVRCGDHGALP
jgi:transcriptional regulator GlxA family with amidase domain